MMLVLANGKDPTVVIVGDPLPFVNRVSRKKLKGLSNDNW
jgi:hypothetical protein